MAFDLATNLSLTVRHQKLICFQLNENPNVLSIRIRNIFKIRILQLELNVFFRNQRLVSLFTFKISLRRILAVLSYVLNTNNNHIITLITATNYMSSVYLQHLFLVIIHLRPVNNLITQNDVWCSPAFSLFILMHLRLSLSLFLSNL